uniref:Envelope glycoprotein n=1 Tax=Oreochromis niloticus TaxID=8128 RepID=A0A669C0V2_ORENI
MKLLLISLTLAALVAGCLILLRKNDGPRKKRAWTHDNSHHYTMIQDNIHPWMNNAWYRYIHDSTPTKDCYVCSHMPPTTQYGKAMNMTQVKCAASYASLGYQYSGIVINHNEPSKIGLRNGTCDEWFWVDLKVKQRNKAGSFPVFLENPGNWDHTLCYRQSKGTIDMGNTTNCKAVVTHALGGPVKNNDISNGTYWVQGMAWLCGQRAYFTLPQNWTGMCAPIFISDHTFKITTDDTSLKRGKRSVDTPDPKPHDPIWGSDVPQEFKLWTTGQKVLHSLFPWVGTGKIALRIETLNYRFGLFLNTSCRVNDQQNEEIDALRIMVMQHQVALDIVLAEKGGLCVLFNTTCCTYIPDNIHSSNMTDALKVLKRLQNVQSEEYVDGGTDWLRWLLNGSWTVLLYKGLIFIGLLLILFCVFSTCILPCLRKMISKMISTSLIAYVTVPLDDKNDLSNSEDNFEDEDVYV